MLGVFIMTEHDKYMYRCIQLAEKAKGSTYPNPLVGCVIVHNGKIIGEGYHKKAGEPHAEINALNSVTERELLSQSTVYVSLEPCAHYGRTPPCALKLVETGVKKVVIGSMDSYEEVNGKGKQILEQAGIEVISGVLEKECKELNKRFFTFHRNKRPYITLKWAQSADGFMDRNFQPVQIGNPLTKQYVHQLRSDEHSILVGTNTVLHDNPELTAREIFGRSPVRIIFDHDLKVPQNFKIFNSAAPTFVFNSVKEEIQENIHFIKTEKHNFLKNLMDKLFQMQIQSILVEGGAFTLHRFIEAGIWDEAIIIRNNNMILEAGTKSPVLEAQPARTVNFAGNPVDFYLNLIS